MKLGIRARVFATSALIFVTLGLLAGLWLDARLHADLVDHITVELTEGATIGSRAVVREPGTESYWATEISEGMDVRATVVSHGGLVLADSHAIAHDLDNHADRPEIIEAFEHGIGSSKRFSDTLGADMQYVAVAYGPPGDPTGVFRLAVPLTEVNRLVARQRLLLLLTGLLGLLAALAASAISAHLVTADLRVLIARTRALVGELGQGPDADQIANLSGSVDRAAAELQRRVEAIAAERDRFQAVLDAMEEGVLDVDANGQVAQMNPAARYLLGLRDHGTEGDVLRITGMKALADVVGRALEGQPAHLELTVPTVEADDRPGNRILTAGATPRAGGGAVLVLEDVTKVRELSRARQEFASNVSHELRTPVAVLKSSAEALVDGALDDPTHGPRFADAVLRHANRLGTLIDDMLQLARLDARLAPVSTQPITIAEVLDDVVLDLGDRLDKAHDVAIEVPEDITALADVGGLRQVLHNLVENALKYTPAGGNIWVTASATDTEVIVEVRDNGPGIPPEHRGRIFERFYRIDPGRSRQMGGTGLGLAIVRHLIRGMDGTVSVHERHGGGVVFRVMLPRFTDR